MKRSAFFLDNNIVKYMGVDEGALKETSAE